MEKNTFVTFIFGVMSLFAFAGCGIYTPGNSNLRANDSDSIYNGASSKQIKTFNDFSADRDAALLTYIRDRNAEYDNYLKAKDIAFKEYNNFVLDELRKVRVKDCNAYYKYLEAEKFGDGTEIEQLEISSSAIKAFKEAISLKRTTFEEIDKAAYDNFNKVEAGLRKVFATEDNKLAYDAFKKASL